MKSFLIKDSSGNLVRAGGCQDDMFATVIDHATTAGEVVEEVTQDQAASAIQAVHKAMAASLATITPTDPKQSVTIADLMAILAKKGINITAADIVSARAGK